MAVNSATAPDLKPLIKEPSSHDKIAELRAKKKEIKRGGGHLRLEKQHASGKLGARERLEELVDGAVSGSRIIRQTPRHLLRHVRKRAGGRRSGHRMRHD